MRLPRKLKKRMFGTRSRRRSRQVRDYLSFYGRMPEGWWRALVGKNNIKPAEYYFEWQPSHELINDLKILGVKIS